MSWNKEKTYLFIFLTGRSLSSSVVITPGDLRQAVGLSASSPLMSTSVSLTSNQNVWQMGKKKKKRRGHIFWDTHGTRVTVISFAEM